MTKINQLLAKENTSTLVSYIMTGDPDLNSSYKIAETLIKSGTKILELGVPFSDPAADGLTIQKAAKRALKNDISLKDCFLLAKKLGKNYPEVPIILMGYLNPIFHYGTKKFAKEAIKNNVSGLIIVDLPYEEQKDYPELNSPTLPLIQLITPLSTRERLKNILAETHSFLYFISVFGVTGTKKPNLDQVIEHLKELKTDKKIAVGFGINSKSQITTLQADLIVIGSAYIKIIEENLDNKDLMLKKLRKFNLSLF